MKKTITFEDAVKTIARFWSVLSTIMILLFLFGKGPEPAKFKLIEWIGFIFFPAGVLVGLIISWKKEIAGGIVTIASTVIFSFIMAFSWFIVALGFPALLFIFHGVITKTKIEGRNAS